jgi:hypothetical protein
MKKVLVRNLFTFALAIASSQLYAVTWVHHKYETSAGWSGGSEIDGYTSYSDTWSYDSDNPTLIFTQMGFRLESTQTSKNLFWIILPVVPIYWVRNLE